MSIDKSVAECKNKAKRNGKALSVPEAILSNPREMRQWRLKENPNEVKVN